MIYWLKIVHIIIIDGLSSIDNIICYFSKIVCYWLLRIHFILMIWHLALVSSSPFKCSNRRQNFDPGDDYRDYIGKGNWVIVRSTITNCPFAAIYHKKTGTTHPVSFRKSTSCILIASSTVNSPWRFKSHMKSVLLFQTTILSILTRTKLYMMVTSQHQLKPQKSRDSSLKTLTRRLIRFHFFLLSTISIMQQPIAFIWLKSTMSWFFTNPSAQKQANTSVNGSTCLEENMSRKLNLELSIVVDSQTNARDGQRMFQQPSC